MGSPLLDRLVGCAYGDIQAQGPAGLWKWPRGQLELPLMSGSSQVCSGRDEDVEEKLERSRAVPIAPGRESSQSGEQASRYFRKKGPGGVQGWRAAVNDMRGKW